MTRSSAALCGVMAAATLALAACHGSPTGPATLPESGPVIALDSLVSVDSRPLPCCSVDSAGSTITLVAGQLIFHGLANYTDTVPTPDGLMSAACVLGVPNGSFLHLSGLVTVGDSVGYLTIPCTTGTYDLVVRRNIDLSGSLSVNDDTLSLGTYHITDKIPDYLTLRNWPGGAYLRTGLSWDTVMVSAHGHLYRLKAYWTD